MTGRSMPYIVCDYVSSSTCWSLATPNHEAMWGEQGEKYPRIRTRLAALGWTRPVPGLDVCPSCARVDAATLRAEGAPRA